MSAVTGVALGRMRAVYSPIIARSCSGLRPVRTSISASGSSARKRSRPSCAISSAIRIFGIVGPSLCSSIPMVVRAFFLFLIAKLCEANFQPIQGCCQLLFHNVAQVANAEDFAVQLPLSASQYHTILFAQFLEHSFGFDAFRGEDGRDSV